MNPTQLATPTYPIEKKRSHTWRWILGSVGCVTLILLSCGVCAYLMFSAQFFSSTSISDSTYSAKTISGTGDDTVAIIDIKGVVQDFSGAESILSASSASAESVLDMIDYAIEKQEANAILFRLNTPGGTLTASETICKKINDIRDQGIYTMAWVETEGASGGYYIASCTDWILSRQEAITGSIGVVIQVIDVNSFLESIGFRIRTISNTEGILKTGGDIFTEGSETERIYTDILDEGYNQFINAVAEGRKDKEMGLTRAQVIALADGRIYTGAQAESNGLIDGLAYFEDAISIIITKAELSNDAKIVQIQPQIGFFDSIAGVTLRKLIPITIDAKQPGITIMAVSTI